eukprot:scaffold406857_cov29-Prasinocladus_malaysianus.AAC.1
MKRSVCRQDIDPLFTFAADYTTQSMPWCTRFSARTRASTALAQQWSNSQPILAHARRRLFTRRKAVDVCQSSPTAHSQECA